MIIPAYKLFGASSHQLAAKVGQLYNEKATHTGTLDPMAEGVLVVLTGDDRFHKEMYSDVKKTYEFEILCGFSTDSHDLLGLITQHSLVTLNHKSIENVIKSPLEKIQKKKKQLVPAFSAKRIDGKSYFDHAKSTQGVPDTFEPVTIFELRVLKTTQISASELLLAITDKISRVEGDFRQELVLNNWNTTFSTSTIKHFTVIKCLAVTSKRTYIRAIVRDLSELIGVPCTTFSINRTQNGKYSTKDSICLM